jgi:crossover junction endodeoxyribonuclease RusA
MSKREVVVVAPWPPSINNYWKKSRKGMYMTQAGRVFRDEVVLVVRGQNEIGLIGDLAVAVDLYPPDRRVRDIDNCCKSLLDALQHAGVYQDDYQIADLHVRRCECRDGGESVVSIREV